MRYIFTLINQYSIIAIRRCTHVVRFQVDVVVLDTVVQDGDDYSPPCVPLPPRWDDVHVVTTRSAPMLQRNKNMYVQKYTSHWATGVD